MGCKLGDEVLHERQLGIDEGGGQLGDSTTAGKSSLLQVGSGTTWRQVSLRHTVALAADGTLWAWGLNSTGQLGDNSTTQRTAPVQEATAGIAWLAVSAGNAHSLARTANGPNFFSTGENQYGQLSDGSNTQRLTYSRPGNSAGFPLPVEFTAFTATLAGLPAGVSVVRAGPRAVRLMVE